MKYFNFSFCFYHKGETVTFFFNNACFLLYFRKYIGGFEEVFMDNPSSHFMLLGARRTLL